MTRVGVWLIVVTTGLMFGGCGGKSTRVPPSSSARAVLQIWIHGELNQTDNSYCDQTRDLVSHARIVFRDQSGTVLGTATVGTATTRSTSSGIFAACGRSGTYTIGVPKSTPSTASLGWGSIGRSGRCSIETSAAKGFQFDLFVAIAEP